MPANLSSKEPLLVARGVSKRFGAVEALVDVDVVADLYFGSELVEHSLGRLRRSLVTHPRVLFLDEPTAALGVVQTAQVLALIEHLREQGLAIVILSHNLDNVFHVADRIGALPGRAVAA